MRVTPARRAGAGAALWGLLLAPPVRHALEATMARHMLVQIPLLAGAGWLMAGAIPHRAVAGIARWDAGGISAFLLASMTGLVWMLPRALDAAVGDPAAAAAKFVSVPLLIGMSLALGWPRMGFVVRGVLLFEAIATAFRLGWLYLVSPQRLCSNYLLGDQQQVGRLLLAIGGAAGLALAWKLLWGRVEVT